MTKLYIIIPAYNESDNVDRVVNDWYPIIEKFGDEESRLVFIDDGSRDNTFGLLKELAKDRNRMVVLTKENQGHGATVLYGYRYALEHKADFIFQTDSDGQTNPQDFVKFWNVRDQYAIIIGDRTHTRRDGLTRKMVCMVLKIVLFFIFQVRVSDVNTPFRLINASCLRKYIDRLPREYNLPNVMLTVYFKYFHEKMKFIEITFDERKGGKNSINLLKIIRIGLLSVRDFISFRRKIRN